MKDVLKFLKRTKKELDMYNEKHNAFVEEIKNIEININILKDKIKKTRNKKILKQLGKELEFENNCNMITKEKFNKFMDFYKEINENYKKANQYALENFGSTDLKYINRYIDENNFVKYGVNIIKVHGDQFYINKFKNTIYNKMIENFLTKYDLLEEIFKLEKNLILAVFLLKKLSISLINLGFYMSLMTLKHMAGMEINSILEEMKEKPFYMSFVIGWWQILREGIYQNSDWGQGLQLKTKTALKIPSVMASTKKQKNMRHAF